MSRITDEENRIKIIKTVQWISIIFSCIALLRAAFK